MRSCVVAIEACATTHCGTLEIERCGQKVKLIPPQNVKAFLAGNMNDYNDTLAIAVAANQHHIRMVNANTIKQQDKQALHKTRELAIRKRTAVRNHIRVLTAVYCICISRSVSAVRQNIMAWLSEECTELSVLFRQLLFQLKE